MQRRGRLGPAQRLQVAAHRGAVESCHVAYLRVLPEFTR